MCAGRGCSLGDFSFPEDYITPEECREIRVQAFKRYNDIGINLRTKEYEYMRNKFKTGSRFSRIAFE